ncbi:MAG TPA: PKD domain-containing protein, partial [Candidatus Angelobacter sp.]|nr:PKD domain-containing protein [Candidatus Angelobacter sp.]
RGLDGTIIDWYGRGNENKNFLANDQGTQLLMQEAEQHPGFSFALMMDIGANKSCERTPSCNPTENLIEDLNYAYRTYQQSPAYLHYEARPLIFFFGFNGHGIDWHRVRSRVAGNPIFIFRNSGAFAQEESGGGFSWVSPEEANAKDPMALGYLDHYYQTAHRAGTFSLGSAYKGFNDSKALWGTNRLIQQQCGQTWLHSIANASQFYSEQQQMIGIQLVTWNDYEEGTEFETGIANCIQLTSWTKASSVYWKIEGDESTIDHFTVFISRDGENLMSLADLPAGTHSLDLGRFSLEPGSYTTYVKAIGKPSLTNQMSEAHELTISASSGASAQVTPKALQVYSSPGSMVGSVVVNIAGNHGPSSDVLIDFGDGTVLTGQSSAEHVYKLPGVYTVMVNVIDSSGQWSTATMEININTQNN